MVNDSPFIGIVSIRGQDIDVLSDLDNQDIPIRLGITVDDLVKVQKEIRDRNKAELESLCKDTGYIKTIDYPKNAYTSLPESFLGRNITSRKESGYPILGQRIIVGKGTGYEGWFHPEFKDRNIHPIRENPMPSRKTHRL